jgi:glycerophosphoryl diester phosphodiesterase
MNLKPMNRIFFQTLVASLCLGALSSTAVEIVAHRGASHDAPENTLAAFQLGWEQKTDAGETDLWLAKDGQIIISHDVSTKRTTGVEKRIPDATLAELRALDAGAWKGDQWKGQKLPTLAETLATMPAGKRFFLEIKCGVEILPELERGLKAWGKPRKQIVLIAFSYKVATEAKARFPDIEVAWLYDWKKDKDTGVKLSADEIIQRAKAAKVDGLDVEYKGPVDAEFVKKCKAAGLKVYAWTVDDAEAAKRLVAAGVDGITTNRPQWLREQLK